MNYRRKGYLNKFLKEIVDYLDYEEIFSDEIRNFILNETKKQIEGISLYNLEKLSIHYFIDLNYGRWIEQHAS